MSTAAALALTGAVLMFAALVLAFAAEEGRRCDPRARLAWVAFGLACAFLIAGAWAGVTP